MVTPSTQPALVLDRVTVAYGSRVACDSVSLSVAAGSIYALLGRSEAGKSSLLAAVAGGRKPSQGRVLFEGMDTWSDRRRARSFLCSVTPSPRSTPDETLSRALSREPRLLLLDDFDFGGDPIQRATLFRRLRDAAASGMTLMLATSSAGDADGLADRLGILRAGGLRLNEAADVIAERFRKIRYRNEITETRSEYGAELDLFDAVRVRVRGWGIEAVVSNFSADLFERLRNIDGVVDAEASPLSLAEVFEAVSPNPPAALGKAAPRKAPTKWGWRRK
jgi:ABC-type multidrug transport system ATPase subunit